MINTLFRTMYAFNANTAFEKARMDATCNQDYNSPKEYSIKAILNSAKGLDKETRPEVAFQTIVQKIMHSESKRMWNYMIKNLILLDRFVEEKLYLWDICDLKLETVTRFEDQDPNVNKMLIDQLIQKYFKYIKAKASKYTNRDSVFNQQDKNLYISGLKVQNLLIEMKTVQELIQIIKDIIQTSKKGYLQYDLCQYVYLLLLNSLMQYHSMQHIGVINILNQIFKMDLNLAVFYKLNSYKVNKQLKILFKINHQFIKGFQIDQKLLYKPEQDLKQSIVEYIKIIQEDGYFQIEDFEHGEINQDEKEFFKNIAQINRRVSKNKVKLEEFVQTLERESIIEEPQEIYQEQEQENSAQQYKDATLEKDRQIYTDLIQQFNQNQFQSFTNNYSQFV